MLGGGSVAAPTHIPEFQIIEGASEDVILVDFDREKSDLAERFRRRLRQSKKNSAWFLTRQLGAAEFDAVNFDAVIAIGSVLMKEAHAGHHVAIITIHQSIGFQRKQTYGALCFAI